MVLGWRKDGKRDAFTFIWGCFVFPSAQIFDFFTISSTFNGHETQKDEIALFHKSPGELENK